MYSKEQLERQIRFIQRAQDTLMTRVNQQGRHYLVGDEFTHIRFNSGENANDFYNILREAFSNFNVTQIYLGTTRYNFFIHEPNTNHKTPLEPNRLSLANADYFLDFIRRGKMLEVDILVRSEGLDLPSYHDIHGAVTFTNPLPVGAFPVATLEDNPPSYEEIDLEERTPFIINQATTNKKGCGIL